MANQHVNKVAVNGKTVLDLSADTVYPGMLAKGITAHDKSGAKITGALEVPATEERTVELSMPSGNQVIQPSTGKVLSKVTVQKPSTLTAENIKKGVNIGGVTGTLESGGTPKIWALNDDSLVLPAEVIEEDMSVTLSGNFTSNGNDFEEIVITAGGDFHNYAISYNGTLVCELLRDEESSDSLIPVVSWEDDNYRKLVFDSTQVSDDLLGWVQVNATKAEELVPQASKTVEITSNGTTTIRPDTPYDVLERVEVKVATSSHITWYDPV